ncbi:aminotransferase class IV [Cobetia sp. 1CM21F]|uniref:aminotransferase class IV n=1 Tax=Cobetia sp. 1CM21F TaxID=2929163 RepID=UPI0020BDCFD5|nr:aminotransferase class IV [Cobetia sp. 1CM21F]MCK8066910.1 aminotransferase class IV [Cobetia sp. 1CM21F]
MAMSTISSQAYVSDPRNDDVLIYVNGEFKKRNEATVSIFDSGFVLGDGIWEGMRLINGKLLAIDAHMDRLFEGANSIDLDLGMSRADMIGIIRETLRVNDMHDGVHIRLMVSRGLKSTPNQDPRFVLEGPTVVVVAEYKKIDVERKQKGIKLFTSTFRCSTPDVFDLRLNSHSRLNFIQALIQALHAGADEALMLDSRGFVASCNSTNSFIVRKGEVWTSTGLCNFNGLTRKAVIDLAASNGLVVREKDFTLAEVYSAEEAFVTGTLGGLTPVVCIDGRTIGTGEMGPAYRQLNAFYEAYLEETK